MTKEMGLRIVADMKQCLATATNTGLHSSIGRKEEKVRKLPKTEYALWRVLFLRVQERVHSSGHLSPAQPTCSSFGSELIVVVQLHDQQKVEAVELLPETLIVVDVQSQGHLDDILLTIYSQLVVAAVQILS